MTTKTVQDVTALGLAARKASRKLARLSTEDKNRVLLNLAGLLRSDQADVLSANLSDYQEAKSDGMNDSLLDRLLLTSERLNGTADEVQRVAELTDPIGEVIETNSQPNGLITSRRRVPLGVVGSIYEARPNVTVDIFGLCLKSGNACILRGGKETIRSNTALVTMLRKALSDAGVTTDAVQFVDNPDRALVDHLLKMNEYIDLLVPRGGASLVKFVAENATMPAVTGGIGVCHTYVDRAADLKMAAEIVHNAKVRRPSICNALDTVLVHSEIAADGLRLIAKELTASGVELHCDNRALSILGPDAPDLTMPANEDDWGKEFLSLTAAVKVVDSLDDALEHIETYGSGHSEAIITEDDAAATRFLDKVDAAAVYVNASTQFTDGGQFGLGAEVGISTQKFHARGPMGLKELTSYKWVIVGKGHVRP
ncbi:MAG: glutamate-5-semialdehyde dehydrogenase [SAR202 cluster bacterium]|nr:glutamate-5-semialdehyde dehydrogenase [Dehalococcoidia bacterium]MQG15097.1 glutamate-5-semialdehyde dehydrogenase [SAR202 cluster bacterium]MQG31935.1 glutamate-5-semialdehyde dehydrogenase [SAR202 cluster bacterium]MQG41083.1 glutamate-5-semialdehyde dehydrogenase [SAR202 cluster bacterium]MQG45575.1 glutamate-5-semialdehyde dehydrogenase [SAR202 cluster bacterium]|tara:strand:- start:62 stop:1339 length:1278 start_codon:yes stop_codon:yes gene_type:complete